MIFETLTSIKLLEGIMVSVEHHNSFKGHEVSSDNLTLFKGLVVAPPSPTPFEVCKVVATNRVSFEVRNNVATLASLEVPKIARIRRDLIKDYATQFSIDYNHSI